MLKQSLSTYAKFIATQADPNREDIMKNKYENIAGDSGIDNFEITGPGEIIIEFVNPKERYVYDGSAPGALHVGAMIEFAKAGRGLATYISQNVRKNFSRKIPL